MAKRQKTSRRPKKAQPGASPDLRNVRIVIDLRHADNHETPTYTVVCSAEPEVERTIRMIVDHWVSSAKTDGYSPQSHPIIYLELLVAVVHRGIAEDVYDAVQGALGVLLNRLLCETVSSPIWDEIQGKYVVFGWRTTRLETSIQPRFMPRKAPNHECSAPQPGGETESESQIDVAIERAEAPVQIDDALIEAQRYAATCPIDVDSILAKEADKKYDNEEVARQRINQLQQLVLLCGRLLEFHGHCPITVSAFHQKKTPRRKTKVRKSAEPELREHVTIFVTSAGKTPQETYWAQASFPLLKTRLALAELFK